MFKYLFSWPDELPAHHSLLDDFEVIEVLLRKQDFINAEARILSAISQAQRVDPDKKSLRYISLQTYLFLSYSIQELIPQEKLVYESLASIKDRQIDPELMQYIHFRYALDTKDNLLPSLANSSMVYRDSKRLPFCLLYVEFLLLSGDYTRALSFLSSIPSIWKNTLEYSLLLCHLHEISNRWDLVLNTLLESAYRCTTHMKVWCYLMVATVEAKSHEHTIPVLRKAISLHGDNPHFFSHFCRISLLKFRSADARRYSLKDRLSKLTRTPSQKPFLTNLWVTQDRLGYSEWIDYLSLSDYDISQLPMAMLEPLLLQNASINSNELSKKIIAPILEDYSHLPIKHYSLSKSANKMSVSSIDEPLRIAWVSSDICHHPVARFLLGFFASYLSPRHQHFLVDINDYGSESFRSLFESLSSIDVFNYSSGTLSNKVDKYETHPMLPLIFNGWTGGNLMKGFYHRLAPVQINYLGYFASTGLPSMDYWLGDSNLFPQSYPHWHSEQLLRLQRCFIAWQPPDLLVESNIPVTKASMSHGIHFGSFNNNRKLSNSTLRLWGKILNFIPGSKLVLKASNQDDPATEELLRRRMKRNELDPEAIIWLPRTKTHSEHLNQYSHIDVALDCFPNGGCTTTCESLWMGVPVITLSGTSYVSRMSTAVLHGADLSDWCMKSQQEYLNFAVAQSQNLNWLRSHRDHWRNKVLSGELGNASSLMNSLESLFSNLFTS